MFDAIAILIVTSTFLVMLWLSLLLARFLLSAILVTMQHGAHRGPERAVLPRSTKQLLQSINSIGEPREDSHRR